MGNGSMYHAAALGAFATASGLRPPRFPGLHGGWTSYPDDVSDPALKKRIESSKDGAYDSKGSQYSPLTVVSTRVLHLIVAEDALARGDMEGFTTHVNHVRAMDGLTPFSGQIAAMDMLQHERVNATFMGLRLADMYRFGIVDPRWQPNGDTRTAPGTLLPITLVEVRANCYLNGLGC